MSILSIEERIIQTTQVYKKAGMHGLSYRLTEKLSEGSAK